MILAKVRGFNIAQHKKELRIFKKLMIANMKISIQDSGKYLQKRIWTYAPRKTYRLANSFDPYRPSPEAIFRSEDRGSSFIQFVGSIVSYATRRARIEDWGQPRSPNLLGELPWDYVYPAWQDVKKYIETTAKKELVSAMDHKRPYRPQWDKAK